MSFMWGKAISIFSVPTSETPYFIPNGILDLNHQFNLRKAPHQRQIATVYQMAFLSPTAFLTDFRLYRQRTNRSATFAIELEQDLYCLRDDFILFAQQTSLQEIQTLAADSPSKTAWVQEDIALHCVILAGLFKSGASKFMPYTF